MSGRQSAYAALGLPPDADRVQIDHAYHRLIKLYHPDRPGGDGERAAEINRAYRELRDLPPATLPVRVDRSFAADRQRPRFRFRGVVISALAVAGIFLISRNTDLLIPRSPIADVLPLMQHDRDDNSTSLVRALDNFDEPLSKSTIDSSAADALRLYRAGDPASLARYSQACQSEFRNHPDIVWFDSCAAYDEAAVLLESRDPTADSGPFNSETVTAREMGAAGLLTDDSLAADSRLHQIRSRVELVLLSQLPQ